MIHPWHDIQNPIETCEEGFEAVIEISRGSRVKYELDKDTGMIRVDRVLYSPSVYPANYGFIPRSYCEDGDPLDVLVLGEHPIVPGALMKVRAIGVMHMQDGGEMDDKIIGVCADDVEWDHVKDLSDIAAPTLAILRHFFEDYKTLQKKEVLIEGFGDAAKALEVVKESFEYYAKEEDKLRAGK